MRLDAGRAVVESYIRDVMVALKFFQHVVGADLAALINGMKQFGFEPKNSQIRVPGFECKVLRRIVTSRNGQTRDVSDLTRRSLHRQRIAVARFRN